MNKPKLSEKKKVVLFIFGFIVLIIITSVIYLAFNPAEKPSSNKAGGTGGEYVPSNTVDLTNEPILSDAIPDSAFSDTKSLIDTAVLYNISISNNPDAPLTYIQLGSFDINTAKLYKNGASYSATIVNGVINSNNGIPWNYWFDLKVNDGRKFRADIDVNPDNDNNLISIKKTN